MQSGESDIWNKEIMLYSSELARVVFKPFGFHKILLLAFGWAIVGPWGMFPGLILGMMLDTHIKVRKLPTEPLHIGIDYLMLVAFIIKPRKEVSPAEESYLHIQLNALFGPQFVAQYYGMTVTFLNQKIQFEAICEQISFYQTHREKIRLVHILTGLCQIQGIREQQIKTILLIAEKIGLNKEDLGSFSQKKVMKQSDSYSILGVEREMPFHLIKKAYYRLALKTHPDLKDDHNSSGSMRSREAFQRILDAYNEIKTERGIK